MQNQILASNRLKLRAVEPSDIDTLYQWENDPSIWKVSNTLTPYSRFQIEEYVMNVQNDIYSTRQLRLMIVGLSGEIQEKAIGAIDLFEFDPFHLRAGIGILVRSEFRKSGYASEALELLIRYAFNVLNLRQLYSNVTPENTASISLFEKHGFERCGIKKDWIRTGSSWLEEWMFQLIHRYEQIPQSS
ncbi:MAG: GNAT family N-acetyltransferase [Bacteroidetes bacterium]|nr:GNAT family N-acetyltransferase [Bacteroidota bacterium]